VAFSTIQTLSGGRWLNKKYRLRKNKDFQYTYKKGRSFGHPLLVIIFRKTNQATARVGFSITKKYGKAVQRNRIKRRLREIIRSRINRIKQGYDIVFAVRKDAKDACYKDLDDAVHILLKRAKLYKEGERE
jgi:ribonuclease P protein component